MKNCMKRKIYLWIWAFLCLIVSLWIFVFLTKKDYQWFVAPWIYVENPTNKQYFVEGKIISEKKDFPFENLNIYTDFEKENGEHFLIDTWFLENIKNWEYLELVLGKNHYHMQFQDLVMQDWQMIFTLRSEYFNGKWSYFYDPEEKMWFWEINISSTDWVNASFELKFDTLWNAFFLDTDIEKPQATNINF